MINVLMTGAGAPGGPGILKSLQSATGISLHVADMDPMASGRFLHDSFFLIPPADDANFIKTLECICRENRIDVILPLVTRELLILSKYRKSFEAFGTRIIVSPLAAIELLNDKGRLYDALRDNDLPHPEYYVTDEVDKLIKIAKDFRDRGQACVIKPCLGNGSRGIRVIRDDVSRYDLLFNHKPNSLYMSLDELEVVMERRRIPRMVVSEFLPGKEVTVDTLHRNGNLELILIRNRTKMSGGISVKGEFIAHDQIDKSVRDICEKVHNLHGPIGFQLKQNAEGFYHFIESNPRIQGTSVAASGLGINFPEIAVQIAMGNSIKIPVKRDGVAFIRYFEEAYYDL